MSTLVWFRDDLRTSDHPALRRAVDRGEPVVCLYVLDEESEGVRPLGGAARWWLHHSLTALGERIAELGGRLVLRRGAAGDVVPEVAREAQADLVLWNRRYGGPERAVDAALKEGFGEDGIEAHSFAASLLFEPWTVRTRQDERFKVFSPFWRACLEKPEPRRPEPAPERIPSPQAHPRSEDLGDWGLLPTAPDWSGGIAEAWEPGEAAAERRLERFLADAAEHYEDERDLPGVEDATSGLSPHLRWGEISPYTVWHRARESGRDVESFLSEIGWREFAWHTLYAHPDLATVNLDRRFDAFPWPELDEDELAAWRSGTTGVALVDAGMRELWHTGTMHNRVRMVAASFLVKNLLIDWRVGERWFWDTLVDADAASNPFNWQWIAGCGADAAPYFRVFNPDRQVERFDPRGVYLTRWGAAEEGREPIVDLKESRKAALAAFEEIKQEG